MTKTSIRIRLLILFLTLILVGCGDESTLSGHSGKTRDHEFTAKSLQPSEELKGTSDLGTPAKGEPSTDVDVGKPTDQSPELETDLGDCLMVANSSEYTEILIPGAPKGLKYDLQYLLEDAEWDGDDLKFAFHSFQHGDAAIFGSLPMGGMFQELLTLGQQQWLIERPEGEDGNKYIETWFEGRIKNANSAKCSLEGKQVEKSILTVFAERAEQNGGCFDAETLIRMADGRDKAIKHLQTGDLVYNPVLKRAFAIGTRIAGPETKHGMIEVGVNGRTVLVTRMHPFETNNGLKTAHRLLATDRILDVDGTYKQITALKKLPPNPNQVVYNFVVQTTSRDPSHHMVLANGIVTGDLFLQRQLEAREADLALPAGAPR